MSLGLDTSPSMGDHQRLEARLLLRQYGLQQQGGDQEAGVFMSLISLSLIPPVSC